MHGPSGFALDEKRKTLVVQVLEPFPQNVGAFLLTTPHAA
jgi:hypothetical protein